MRTVNTIENTARTATCKVCGNIFPLIGFISSSRDFRVRNACTDCRKKNPTGCREFYIANRPKALAKYAERRMVTRLIYDHLLVRYKFNKKEVSKMSIKKQARDFYNLPDKIAAIIGKTFVVRGDDDKTISDDEAIMRIRDALEEIDERIIERNKNKRLSKT